MVDFPANHVWLLEGRSWKNAMKCYETWRMMKKWWTPVIQPNLAESLSHHKISGFEAMIIERWDSTVIYMMILSYEPRSFKMAIGCHRYHGPRGSGRPRWIRSQRLQQSTGLYLTQRSERLQHHGSLEQRPRRTVGIISISSDIWGLLGDW